ncbi:MAG: molybdopterin-guanine dinucleotide biosynthesis protein B [Rhodospirillaceae bacterium]|nr:molybdopterin-guanine dinucleotide biosynthesis protein B [Rhodospirillaceae bacterium]
MRAFGIIGNCRGKNRLVPQLVEALRARGVGVSTLKRVGDEIDLDRPGKESYAHRQAGAGEVMIANAFRYAIMSEYDQPTEPDIDALLARLSPTDLVLIEGFHLAPYPKCEIVLAGQDRRPSYPDDPSILALVTNEPVVSLLPCFAPDAVDRIVTFILANACATRTGDRVVSASNSKVPMHAGRRGN